MSEIDLQALRDELASSLSRNNIHILREQGIRLGVKSVTTHSKSKLVSLIVEKKMLYHKSHFSNFTKKTIPIPTDVDKDWLMGLAESYDDIDGEMVSGTLELNADIDGYLRVNNQKIKLEDVFVSQWLINYSDLRYGDYILGKAVRLQNSEVRALIGVTSINGERTNKLKRNEFLEMQCVLPSQRIRLDVTASKDSEALQPKQSEKSATKKKGAKGSSASSLLDDANSIPINPNEDSAIDNEQLSESEQTSKISEPKLNSYREQQLSCTLKMIDIYSPIVKGGRNLLVATSPMNLIELICASIDALAAEGISSIVLCLSERAEMRARLRARYGTRVIATTTEFGKKGNLRLAQLITEQLKRRAEGGKDVALVVTNIGSIFGESARRILEREFDYKSLFGAARSLAEGGSLTVIAFNYMLGACGQAVYEALAPLANSVAILNNSLHTHDHSQCPRDDNNHAQSHTSNVRDSMSLNINDSFTDFYDYNQAEADAVFGLD